VHVIDANEEIEQMALATEPPQGHVVSRTTVARVHGQGDDGPNGQAGIAAGGQTLPRGVSPAGASRFTPVDVLCFDKQTRVPIAAMNDDFCDCPGGGDEPGTGACPEDSFYCPNAGHAPATVVSARVNDGVCDCCDGSDEWGSENPCSNTCQDAAAASRETERTREAGRALQQRYAVAGRAAKAALGQGDQDPAWGPHDAFHHLDGKCFATISTDYKYGALALVHTVVLTDGVACRFRRAR
jgi:hypothetical protein